MQVVMVACIPHDKSRCLTGGGRLLTQSVGLSLLLFAGGQNVIWEPPEITEPLDDEEIFLQTSKSDTLNVKCTALGRPKPFYTWHWNGIQIVPRDRISSDSKTGRLTVNSFTSADDGVYSCHANVTFTRNRWAVAVSPKIKVHVARIEPWPSRESMHENRRDASEGSNLIIYCDDKLPKSYGPTAFAWATSCKGIIYVDENHFIDRNGNLYIFYAKNDEKCNDYYCGLRNDLLGILTFGEKTTIDVSGSIEVKESVPIVLFHTGQFHEDALTFEVESDARLECVIRGYVRDPNATTNDPAKALPTITWLNDRNETIVSGQDRYQIKDYGRALTIKNVVESDEKTYTCLGANKLGRVGATMTLNVTSHPIWVKTLVSLTVVQGQDAIFHCRARSALSERPPSVPVWYKNGLRLDSVYDPKKYEFSDEKRVMKVMSARKLTDIACFRCFVSNSVGRVVGAACLNVILPIEIITQPRANQVVKKGDDVDLTVVARSDPLTPVTYVWHFKNRTYTAGDAPPYVLYDAVTKLAFIDTANFSRRQMRRIAGLYTREIYHRFQRISVDVNVITNRTTGEQCTTGYHGPRCRPCGMCADNTTCHKITGSCLACQPGFRLPLCDPDSPAADSLDSTGLGSIVIWASACGALLLGLAIAGAVLLTGRSRPEGPIPDPRYVEPLLRPPAVDFMPVLLVPEVAHIEAETEAAQAEAADENLETEDKSEVDEPSGLTDPEASAAYTDTEVTEREQSMSPESDTDTGDVIFADTIVYAERAVEED